MCASVARGLAQEEAPAPTFFAGTVVSSTPVKITVTRRGLGTISTTKTFAIDASTKIEGTLKPKVHATVQFVKDESGSERAVRIVVRVVR
jgi:carbamate kinase